MNRYLLTGLAGLAGLCLVMALGLLAVRTLDGMIDKATTAARAERDHYWRGEIDQANTALAKREAEQVREVLRIQAVTSALIQSASDDLEKRKKESAALPNGDACGLDRDRVRLLPD